jgi:2-dehydro-3-deoxyphosphogluconate aldolase / (4S)-4-hydroxy-2-oxoglutarate aldolase
MSNYQPILPVYSHTNIDQCIKVLQASYDAGIRRFEFTNRDMSALSHFAALRKMVDDHYIDFELGAGTIMNVSDAKEFMAVGADFLISPLISQELLEYTLKNNISWLPGCATGAEIGMAQNGGLSMVKLYPIKTLGGPEFIKQIKGPFYKMKFQASGGIKGDTEEVNALLDAGASIVGLGNSFFDQDESQDELTARIKGLLDSLV